LCGIVKEQKQKEEILVKKRETLCFWKGGDVLLQGSQAASAGPSDKDTVKVEALGRYVQNACQRDDGIFIAINSEMIISEVRSK
jgi:hypothetical protein